MVFLFCFVCVCFFFNSAPGTSKSSQKVQYKMCRKMLLSSCMKQSRYNAFRKDTSWVIADVI